MNHRYTNKENYIPFICKCDIKKNCARLCRANFFLPPPPPPIPKPFLRPFCAINKTLIFVSCFTIPGNALKCYECESTKKPDCGLSFRESSFEPKECPDETTSCALQRQKVSGKDFIDNLVFKYPSLCARPHFHLLEICIHKIVRMCLYGRGSF